MSTRVQGAMHSAWIRAYFIKAAISNPARESASLFPTQERLEGKLRRKNNQVVINLDRSLTVVVSDERMLIRIICNE